MSADTSTSMLELYRLPLKQLVKWIESANRAFRARAEEAKNRRS